MCKVAQRGDLYRKDTPMATVLKKVTWGDPPLPRRAEPSDPWAAIATALRQRPGKWAQVAKDASAGQSASITSGKLAAFKPAGTFEATARKQNNGNGSLRYAIWARYIGPLD